VRVAITVLLCLSAPRVLFAQADPKTALLERMGLDALRAGEVRRAADAFHQAIAADPKNPRLYVEAGVAAWLERKDEEARIALERALELEPSLDEARQVLGHVYYRLGDLPAAVNTYETLVGRSGGGEHVATLDRWRRELDLQTRMRQVIGNHFSISFDGPTAEDLSGRALESLDRAYWRIGQVLGVYPASPIAVVLYSSEQFRDITRSPSWAAAAYDGTIRVPMRGALANSQDLDRVLAHEFTHALVRSFGTARIPTWLNEGLATALERTKPNGRLSDGDRSPAPPLSLLAGSFERLNGPDAELAYAVSAAAVERLLDAAGGIAIANLLRDLNGDLDFDTAFAHRMPWTFAEFTGSLTPPSHD
jgi:tetratricopeptide (TPR) repeat protein